MKAVKIIIYTVLTLFAAAILAFSGFFLWQALPREEKEPEILRTDAIFQAEEAPIPQEPAPITEEPPEEAPLPAESEPTPVEEEPTDGLPAVPSETSPRARAEAWLASMTLDEKLWQLFIVTPEALTGSGQVTQAGEDTKAALEARPVGGLCYFAANLVDASQTALMLQNTQTYAKTSLFLSLDEEGGAVSRAGRNEKMNVTHLDDAADYGRQGDVAAVYAAGKTLGKELSALGFNLNLAPVADVSGKTESSEIGRRAYSADPEVTAAMVSNMVEGLQRGGILSCLKHFPGHGSVQSDSHAGTGVSTRTLEELRQTDWLPFQAGIESGALFVLLSHQTNENLSALPCSLSPEVVRLLREELGFAGLIVTDALNMGAITDHYSSGEAAVLAIQAGCDLLLMPEDLQAAFDGLKAAAEDGTISEDRIDESVLRILTIKYGSGIQEKDPVPEEETTP